MLYHVLKEFPPLLDLRNMTTDTAAHLIDTIDQKLELIALLRRPLQFEDFPQVGQIVGLDKAGETEELAADYQVVYPCNDQ